MLAKTRLNRSVTQHLDTDGVTILANIGDINYSVRNLARYTNYVLQTTGGNLEPPFALAKVSSPRSYVFTDPTFTNTEIYYWTRFDRAPLMNVPSQTASGNGRWIYVPENNRQVPYIGQTSYYAITAKYQPVYVIWDVVYTQVPLPGYNRVSLIGTDINDFIGGSTLNPLDPDEDDRNYVCILFDIDGPGTNGSIKAGTCFKNEALMYKAAWLVMKGTGISPGGWDESATPAPLADPVILADLVDIFGPPAGRTPPPSPPGGVIPFPLPTYKFYKFEDATSYFRINVGGKFVDPATSFFPRYSIPPIGVIRGVAYDATINALNGHGFPYEWMLDGNGPDPLEAVTAVSITVKILDWVLATAPESALCTPKY